MVEYDGGGGGATSSYEYKIPGQGQTASAQKPKGTGSGPDNLWNSILEDVVKRDDQLDSYLILLGNPGCGKRSVVREINSKYV